MRIDCDDCRLQHSPACDDCVVTFLLELDDEGPVVIDFDTELALRSLEDAGLAPGTRFTPRPGAAA